MSDQSSPSDSELVAGALADKHAFALLVRRWEPMLMRYVRRILGRNEQVVDDVLQDVFIKVYVNLNGFDRNRPFGPWIYRIARNEAISFLRKMKIEPPTVTGDDARLLFERMTDGKDVQVIADGARMQEQVRAAIAGLDLRYREALMLRFLEDKGYDEIADILQLPSGTVATLINRGTKQLRSALQSVASSRFL